MQMTKYRKKPIVIEAIQITTENAQEIAKLLGSKIVPLVTFVDDFIEDDPNVELTIRTLEGDMQANLTDYIIKGVKGEFYPCKPDIFEMTYDKLEETK